MSRGSSRQSKCFYEEREDGYGSPDENQAKWDHVMEWSRADRGLVPVGPPKKNPNFNPFGRFIDLNPGQAYRGRGHMMLESTRRDLSTMDLRIRRELRGIISQVSSETAEHKDLIGAAVNTPSPSQLPEASPAQVFPPTSVEEKEKPRRRIRNFVVLSYLKQKEESPDCQ